MTVISHDWTALEPELREAAATPGGMLRMADRTGIAYSTIKRQVQKLGLSPVKAQRRKVQEKAAKHYRQKYKFNAKIPAGRAPDGPVVVPKVVKITKCPGFEDRRFAPDPGLVGEFTREWQRLRGKHDPRKTPHHGPAPQAQDVPRNAAAGHLHQPAEAGHGEPALPQAR